MGWREYLGMVPATPERRNSVITQLALQAIQARASLPGSRSTGAREMAAGLLSRALAGATVSGPAYARSAITPQVLSQIGRDLIVSGESLHVIRVDEDGQVRLFPSSAWTIVGDYDPVTWRVSADLSGPSRTHTQTIAYSGVVHLAWGVSPQSPHAGRGPLSWASLTAKTNAETERSIGDEAGGPVGQLLPVPTDGGDPDDESLDPLSDMKNDIRNARGAGVLLETVRAGWGEGPGAAPKSDWKANRLGPDPGAAFVEARRDAEAAVLNAAGCFAALFAPGADGTAQREALRRLHLQTLAPLAKLIEAELSTKLEASVRIGFDLYGFDLAGRAMAFGKLVNGGMAVDAALSLTGLLGATQGEAN